jgi:hypothetical protein
VEGATRGRSCRCFRSGEATRHRDVGDVHRPHLVRPRDLHPAQQIRVDLVAGLGLRRVRAAIQRLYRHPPHQRFDMPTADLASLGSQQASQHPRAGKWKLQMQPVKTAHDLQVDRRHRTWQVVDTATADAQYFRLLCDRQIMLKRMYGLPKGYWKPLLAVVDAPGTRPSVAYRRYVVLAITGPRLTPLETGPLPAAITSSSRRDGAIHLRVRDEPGWLSADLQRARDAQRETVARLCSDLRQWPSRDPTLTKALTVGASSRTSICSPSNMRVFSPRSRRSWGCEQTGDYTGWKTASNLTTPHVA